MDTVPPAASGVRSTSSFLFDKAFVDGQWVGAKTQYTKEVYSSYLNMSKSFTESDVFCANAGEEITCKWNRIPLVTNPSTGKGIGSVPDMNADDTQQAIEKANLAFLKWRDTTAKERSLILRKWFDLTIQNKLELAKLLTAENGKPLQQAYAEISTASGFIEWHAEEAKRVYGDVIPSTAASKKLLVLKQPIGVAGMITPVEGIVEDAKRLGARLGCGGKRGDKGENFFEPTLLSDVTLEMRCAKEEIFGPVAAVMKFKTEEEAVAIANSSSSGLAGYFYSQNLSPIWRVAEKLEVGLCGVNDGLISAIEAPFGGVKESGLGREGGKYGIDEFLEIKYVCLGGI